MGRRTRATKTMSICCQRSWTRRLQDFTCPRLVPSSPHSPRSRLTTLVSKLRAPSSQTRTGISCRAYLSYVPSLCTILFQGIVLHELVSCAHELLCMWNLAVEVSGGQ